MADLIVGNVNISQLSDEELYENLVANGVAVGPIVGTTRKVYQRKLAVLMGANLSSCSLSSDANNTNASDDDENDDDVEPSQAYLERLATGPARLKRQPVEHVPVPPEEEFEDEFINESETSNVSNIYSPTSRPPLKSTAYYQSTTMDSSSYSSMSPEGLRHRVTREPLVERQDQPSLSVVDGTINTNNEGIFSTLFTFAVVIMLGILFYVVFISRGSLDEFSRLEHLAKTASEAVKAQKKQGVNQ